MIFSLAKIDDVDAFADALISELSEDGKTLAFDADSLKAILKSFDDPAQEPISVESAVGDLGGNYKAYRSNGKETSDPDLSEYHFLCAFEQLELQNGQSVDRY